MGTRVKEYGGTIGQACNVLCHPSKVYGLRNRGWHRFSFTVERIDVGVGVDVQREHRRSGQNTRIYAT